MDEFVDKDMNFNAVNRFRLQRFIEAEGYDAPWADDVSAQLAFPAGLIWYSDGYSTIRFSYEAYAGDPTPGPGIHRVCRHLEVASASGTSPISYIHNLNCFPNVQFMDSSAFTELTPTTLTWTDANTVTVTFTGTWPASIAIFSG